MRSAGIRDGSFVGLHLDRSIDYVSCLSAILKTNSAVVPLPPSYPEARLRDILAFSELDAVIDDETTPLNPQLSRRILHVADLSKGVSDPGGGNSGSPDQPAFILCSSGSTGTPKMIVRSHRSFFHRLNWTWDHHPYATGEACCQKSFMTTTHAIYELFEPLLRGVPVVIISDRDVRNLELFWDTIKARGISRLLIVPSVLQASLDMAGFVAPAIKVLVLMGEYVHPRLAARAIESFPQQTRIYSIYGSTEASSTLVCDLKDAYRAGEELPLGKPISPDVQAFVLGSDLRPVGPGDVGVLHVAGSALFKEYFRDPTLTASVFVKAPDREDTLYDTHDQVRRMPDGNLQFVGRIDHTVKIRGFRVDLQEVESTLLQHPEVRQAAVVPSDRDPGGSLLLAFIAPGRIDQSSVYQVLREHLPAYMVPSVLVGLDALPLTPSGKIDRMKLLEDHAQRGSTRAVARDQSDTQRRVLDVWRDVLKHGDIQLDSSFFEVGGSSLTVFGAVQRLREAFALDRSQFTEQTIYRFPTVEALAAHIDSVKAGHAPLAPPATANDILVTLKKGDGSGLPPLFVIASAGGTLGAYDKFARTLKTRRDVVGVRDPFVWGERDPTMGFQKWIALYVAAILERQAQGPYYVAAYSSAGPFGYEIAQSLRRADQKVALLVLIDPLGIDQESNRRFGYWALRAMVMRESFRRIVRLAGWLRVAALRVMPGGGAGSRPDHAMTKEQFLQSAAGATSNKLHILGFSALLELNTGLPFALTDADLAPVEPSQYLAVLLARVKTVAPDIDPGTIENIAIQYSCLQIQATKEYRLRRYDGKVAFFEPDSPSKGLVSVLFRPHVRDMRVRYLKLGRPSDRTRALSEYFADGMRSHYLCMRDDEFVKHLAEALEPLLR